jgi:hypothetical protein
MPGSHRKDKFGGKHRAESNKRLQELGQMSAVDLLAVLRGLVPANTRTELLMNMSRDQMIAEILRLEGR